MGLYKMFKSPQTYIIFALIIIVSMLLINDTTLKQRGVGTDSKANTEKLVVIPTKPNLISCTRSIRLDNKPAYDRALSLIEERYEAWEKSGEGWRSWYFFPSQLVNCVKIEEENVREKTGGEGSFTFNSTKTKENYFPIVVDTDYSQMDESVNSLLLIHEITHV